MRRATIWSAIRWAAAFVNVTLHTCTPALAADTGGLVELTTTPCDDAGFDLAPEDHGTKRLYLAWGDGVDGHRPGKLEVIP